MLDLYFQYVVWLNQMLVNSIKWLITNKDAYYVFMCSIPILATIITAIRGQLMTSFDDHKEPTTEQIKEAIDNDLEIMLYEHEKLTNNDKVINRIKRGEELKPIVQYSCILSANEIRRKFENGQRSKSGHRG